MHTLLLAANLPDLPLLERAAAITARLMPKMGTEVAVEVQALPEINGGWVAIRPVAGGRRPLITRADSDTARVVAFGEMTDWNCRSAADAVLQAWHDGGGEAVRQLRGNFAAVVVDRQARRLHHFCDALGRLALRYWHKGSTLLLASHDLPLIATGRVEPDVDWVTATGLASVDWPLDGHTLLRQVKLTDPHRLLTWRDGRTEVERRFVFNLAGRLAANDHIGQNRVVGRMVQALLERTAKLGQNEPRVIADLTAGADSRAVFAALRAMIAPEQLQVQTTGGDGAPDTVIAKRLAKRYGVDHQQAVGQLCSTDEFLGNVQVYAYFRSGATNCSRGMGSAFQYRPLAPVHVGGQGGGELFRGYDYPAMLRRLPRPFSFDEARQHLVDDFDGALGKVVYPEPNRQAVMARQQDVLNFFHTVSTNGYDILDLFSQYERFCRWDPGCGLPHVATHFSLYDDPELLRLAYQLPAPLGRHCRFQREIVRRVLPAAYWMPVNCQEVMLLQDIARRLRLESRKGGWRMASLLGHLQKAWLGLDRRCCWPRLATASSNAGKSFPQLHADQLASHLKCGLADFLLAADGIGVGLLGKDEMHRLIKTHAEGHDNYMQPLGAMITMEAWRRQIAEADRLARDKG